MSDAPEQTGTPAVPTIAIVGAGIAGATAALTLRSAGFAGRVVLIGDEAEEPYRRPPLSKDVLRGTMPAERTRLKATTTWQEQDIELRTSCRVTDVDAAARSLTFDDGSVLAYDQLLLATGGAPRALPGTDGLDGVHTLRTLADVPRLHRALTPGTHVLVVGSGLIGAEVAASARAMDCEVTLLESESAPLSRVLPPVVGAVYAGLHRSHGARLHTDVTVKSVERDGESLVATDFDGTRYRADAVVVAIGMRPETELAERAGVAVDNGIVVDEYFATSVPGIFAAGDVANHPNLVLGGRQRIEHWQNAQEQGAAAARSMLGERTPFARVPWAWSDQYGVSLQITGWPAAGDDVVVRGDLDALDFVAIFHREGRLVGAVGVNRAAEIRAVRTLVTSAPYADPALLADPGTDLAKVDPATLTPAPA